MTSKTTMRRRVAEAGGYYDRSQGHWVLPGARHNCTPWSTETRWLPSLADAYLVALEVAEDNRRVMEFGAREAAYLRANRPI